MKRILFLVSVLFIFFRIDGIECSELVSGEFNSSAGAVGREVIFIDSSLPDVDALLNEWKGKDTVIIGKDGDPWVKMTNALSARKSVRAVHLITHGSPGELWISGEKYDVNTLPDDHLRSWRNILGQKGEVLLYGCKVGEGAKGDEFLAKLASMTGADIAASNTITGFSGLGGDWNLEKSVGVIDNRGVAAQGWRAVLPTPSFAVNGDPLVFNNPSPISAGTVVGSKYLYSNVITIAGQSIDAIVELVELSSGTTLSAFDSTTTPYGNANYFQPNFSLGNSGTSGGGYGVFKFSFILGGSSSPGPAVPVELKDVLINTYDLDGTSSSGKQYTNFNNIGSYTLSTTSSLSYTQNSGVSTFQTSVTTNVSDLPGTVAGDNIRARVAMASVTDINIKVGAITAGGSAYYALDFSQGPLFTNSPIAVNDANTTTVNTPVAGDVLINDYQMIGASASSPPLLSSVASVSKLTDPSHGTVSVNTNGTYVYTPTTGYTGQDSFIYQVCLILSPTVCDTATVTITTSGTPVVAPSVSKSFSPTTITTTGISTLTISLGNSNATAATLTRALTDTLPTNLVVATTPNLGGTCTGTKTATAGGSTVTYASGATIPSGGCTITVDVKSSTNGSYTNTIAAGALQSDLGDNAVAASANLLVSSSPTVSKSFSPSLIATSGVSVLTISLGNANGSAATLSSALVDNLPTNVVVASPLNIGGTCTGTKTATAGGGTVTYASGATIPSGGCTITVDVTSGTNGTYTNTIASGSLVTNLGTYNVAASTNLTVRTPPHC